MSKESRRDKTDFKVYLMIFLLIGFFSLIVLFVFKNKDIAIVAPITKEQIMLEKDGEIVIINQNGLIEYRSKNGIFFETWDSSKINNFFKTMQDKAREYLKVEKSNVGCGLKYKVTLYLDGKLVSICVNEDDEIVSEVYEKFTGNTGTNLDDFFEDFSPTNTPGGGGSGTTPTTYFLTSTPTPTIYVSSGSSDTNYPPVKADCEGWQKDIVNNRAIISNTYCTIPTPTSGI